MESNPNDTPAAGERLVYEPSTATVIRRIAARRAELAGPGRSRAAGALLAFGAVGAGVGAATGQNVVTAAGGITAGVGAAMLGSPWVMAALTLVVAGNELDAYRGPTTLTLVDDGIRLDTTAGAFLAPYDHVTGLEERHDDVWVRMDDGEAVLVPRRDIREGDPARFLEALRARLA